ncbi:hypothetical protein QR680_006696 [Steinernema hermaphroditum]|uniref:Protein kinase domain-containing protein n=1 Tax=Steinernema hermaphroditum TaxID=289476 RepID=A0AA39HXU4_9BILA|nr:hypothetical protein QR680_006696 [Steinernema hermaphroditum]
MDKETFLRKLATSIEPIRRDRRDEWPCNLFDNYRRDDALSRGTFKSVHAARAAKKFGTIKEKACVVKSVSLETAFKCFAKCNNCSPAAAISTFCEDILMELMVLSRVRHRNLLHLHLVHLHREDLFIVLPRCYSLRSLVGKYQKLNCDNPVPIGIIAPIVRQICSGLAYLHSIRIIHRKVNPDNVFLTRGGTVKLGSFSSARFVPEHGSCHLPPPDSSPEFMSPEMRAVAKSIRRGGHCCDRGYSAASDIWSVGVLMVHMVSFFPNERCRRLAANFADLMSLKKMPFHFLISDMTQLRVRLLKSGGEEMKLFISKHFLNLDTKQRVCAEDVDQMVEMKLWCHEDLAKDKQYVYEKFILELDFANKFKLESSVPNYEWLESKNIPIEMYWNDSWRAFEGTAFSVVFKMISTSELSLASSEQDNPRGKEPLYFQSDLQLIRLIQCHIELGDFENFDLIPVESETKKLLFKLFQRSCSGKAIDQETFESAVLELSSRRYVKIYVALWS